MLKWIRIETSATNVNPTFSISGNKQNRFERKNKGTNYYVAKEKFILLKVVYAD